MDQYQQYQMQPQGVGSAPTYYPPAEKTAPMQANQYGGHQATYPASQYQAQPMNFNGASGSQYQAMDNGYAPSNEGLAPKYGGYGAAAAAPASSSGSVFGMKRTVLFSVAGAGIILVALVIGLGAGLGVSQNKLQSVQSDLNNALASLSAVGDTHATATPTATTASGTASATTSTSTVLPTSNIECPKTNNTAYTATNGVKFTQFCGIDYSDDGGADLANTKAISMNACMDACAGKKGCQGAGWGYLQGDKSLNHTCYMKTNLTKSHSADAAWAFGVLLPSS